MNQFNNIPTNIISGFLGAGKTTAIRHLLKHIPVSETWAVIVNEFGQIGIDGALLKNDRVAIKEIPGGCLCCVGSQSLSVGLNQIIRTVKPNRILIEPTGLGHPVKLIESLTGEFYQSVLDLKAVINLIDARNLSDERYLNHQTFTDQSQLADVLVATKLDCCSEDDIQRFNQYAGSFKPQKIKVETIELGQLKLEWLDISRATQVLPENAIIENKFIDIPHSHIHSHAISQHQAEDGQAKMTGWEMQVGKSDGFVSVGWKINNTAVFKKTNVLYFIKKLVKGMGVERVKGVLNTGEGWVSINVTQHESQISAVDAYTNNIFEIIASQTLDPKSLNISLISCLK